VIAVLASSQDPERLRSRLNLLLDLLPWTPLDFVPYLMPHLSHWPPPPFHRAIPLLLSSASISWRVSILKLHLREPPSSSCFLPDARILRHRFS
jgi:hypothetical protein